jgi:hypothetical protein
MSSNMNSRQRMLIIVLMGLGILFTAFFGWRAFHALKRFNGHRPPPQGHLETDVELIRDWMTVPFISRMYRVHEEIIFESLDIPGKENRDKSLKDLNREYYPEADGIVLEKVKATIFANQPPPTPRVPVAP